MLLRMINEREIEKTKTKKIKSKWKNNQDMTYSTSGKSSNSNSFFKPKLMRGLTKWNVILEKIFAPAQVWVEGIFFVCWGWPSVKLAVDMESVNLKLKRSGKVCVCAFFYFKVTASMAFISNIYPSRSLVIFSLFPPFFFPFLWLFFNF